MNAHTPTPWIVQHEEHNEWRFNIVQSVDEGNVIAGPFVRRTSFAKDDIALANAAFICHAVNNHDKLVAFIRAYMAFRCGTMDGTELDELADETISQAALAAESEAK